METDACEHSKGFIGESTFVCGQQCDEIVVLCRSPSVKTAQNQHTRTHLCVIDKPSRKISNIGGISSLGKKREQRPAPCRMCTQPLSPEFLRSASARC